jgi:hypothetical protein
MTPCPRAFFLVVAVNVLVFTGLLSATGGLTAATAQESPLKQPVAPQESPIANAMGRLYVFRPIRSFGAHLDDYVTVDGIPVHRIAPGTGFYCDLSPGEYVISVAGHKTSPLEVTLTAGQASYVCVMLHHQGGVSPRGGALTSDQSFDVRKLEPEYGAQRAHEYSLTRETCRR